MSLSGNRNRQKHLQNLENLFGGGGAKQETPTPTKKPVAPSFSDLKASKGGPSKAPSQFKMRLERIKMAGSAEEERAAIEAFLAHHEPPADIEVIFKILRHPDEKFVRRGLAEIVTMLNDGTLAGTALVAEALDELEPRALDEQTKSYIAGIRSML